MCLFHVHFNYKPCHLSLSNVSVQSRKPHLSYHLIQRGPGKQIKCEDYMIILYKAHLCVILSTAHFYVILGIAWI